MEPLISTESCRIVPTLGYFLISREEFFFAARMSKLPKILFLQSENTEEIIQFILIDGPGDTMYHAYKSNSLKNWTLYIYDEENQTIRNLLVESI